MTRIVTGPDGTRYRRKENPCYGNLKEGGGECDSFFAGGHSPDVAICKGHHEPLPRIPNWPLPGPAPQYLSDDPGTPLGPKDLYVNETRYGWAIMENGEPNSIFPQHRTLADAARNSSVGVRAWLIARADPTEDA